MRNALALFVVAVWWLGCQKQVDPAYLAEIEAAASAECRCGTDPALVHACDNPHTKFPNPPPGEPSAFLAYEAKLDPDAQQRIKSARAKFDGCVQVRAQASAFKNVVDTRQDQIMNPDRD